MKLYIAGKITGLVYEDALRAFAEAEAEIERCGHTAVNPMKENGLDGDGRPHEWVEYMERDVPLLLSCDGVYLLPTWKESNGARIEKAIAEHSKMLIVTAGFQGKRGEVFSTESKNFQPKYCGRCGRKLSEVESDLGDGECFRCVNGRKKAIHEIHEKHETKPEEWITCQTDFCGEKFIQTDPDAEVDLCPKCDAAVMRAAGQIGSPLAHGSHL